MFLFLFCLNQYILNVFRQLFKSFVILLKTHVVWIIFVIPITAGFEVAWICFNVSRLDWICAFCIWIKKFLWRTFDLTDTFCFEFGLSFVWTLVISLEICRYCFSYLGFTKEESKWVHLIVIKLFLSFAFTSLFSLNLFK